jgi:hypothetical protein
MYCKKEKKVKTSILKDMHPTNDKKWEKDNPLILNSIDHLLGNETQTICIDKNEVYIQCFIYSLEFKFLYILSWNKN